MGKTGAVSLPCVGTYTSVQQPPREILDINKYILIGKRQFWRSWRLKDL